MDAIKGFISSVLAVAQMLLSIVGIIDIGPPDIQYGGTPYAEPVVSRWLTLVENGVSDYVIIRGANASEPEKNAALELQRYLKQISSAELPILVDAQTAGTPREICVGATDREGVSYSVDRSKLGTEGFALQVTGDRLILAGAGSRGTLYAVYTFLEQQLGCRWFTPELEVIPQTATVRVNAELMDIQSPVFEYRDDYIVSAYDAAWKAKQKLNGSGYDVAAISDAWGGDVRYAYFEHSMRFLVPESEFAAHPEYFSYREDQGQRTTDQRCLTNPDVLALAIQNTRARLLERPECTIISITQNDNSNYCQCENCKASDAKYGAPSGTNIWFVNQVAEALEPEFPEVAFDTFAYAYTRKAPTGIAPRESVIVRLCSIECCYTHPLAECGHERNESLAEQAGVKESTYAQDMADWSAICKRIYVWNYETNFLYYLSPYPNFHVLSANMQYFAENNVRGVFEQGTCSSDKGGEFEELRAYLLAKLLWNPSADVEYHMDEFLSAYYGEKSAPFIKQYIELLTNKYMKTGHMFSFDWHYQGVILMPWEVRKCNGFWESAIKNAGNDAQKSNILRSQLSYRFYKANLLMSEFAPWRLIGRVKENEKLYNDIVAAGITRVDPYIPLPTPSNFFLLPIDWLGPNA